jgi:uncharacterized membrane protein
MDLTVLLPLVGIPLIVLGFALKFNPMLVVTVAGLATGIAVGMSPETLLETFGEKFLGSRQLAGTFLLLPVVGLLERHGLRERAAMWIAGIRGATAGRVLSVYFMVRELSAALGLLSLGGQAQTVRPLLAPMALAAAERGHGDLPPPLRDKIAAHAAASENIALFFGEDVFIAFGAVLLMTAFLKENGILGVDAVTIGLWAIPTALSALAVHLLRLSRLDLQIARDAAAWRALAAKEPA